MIGLRGLAWALFSMTIIETPAVAPPDAPLPAPTSLARLGPPGKTWMHRTARVQAASVRLNGLGIRTHANWVLFQLPFDTGDFQHVRDVVFVPSASVPTDVGALRLGSVCVSTAASGTVQDWSRYTVSGLGYTERFGWHSAPPTSDPTILGINVPTRGANHVACGRDPVLREARAWSLEVSWDER